MSAPGPGAVRGAAAKPGRVPGLPGPWPRQARGLFALATLSMAVVPVTLHLTAAHRAHWFGAAAQGAEALLAPAAGRLQAALAVLAVAGWAAFATPARAPGAGWLRPGLAAGLVGAAVVALAALPGWIWLWRLGLVAPVAAAAIWGLSTAAVFVAALAAGIVGARGPGPGAAAAGWVLGLGLVGLTWPAFGWVP